MDRTIHETDADLLARFLAGAVASLWIDATGRLGADRPTACLLLSGSFNPLHEGHVELAAVAASRAGGPVAFELSVTNVEKPPLDAAEVWRRAVQFAGRAELWLTRAPTFREKARLFPGATFVVGADTAARIVDPRFYAGDERRLAAALDEVRACGCRFLVAGRIDAGGAFVRVEHLPIPEVFRDLFTGLTEAEFRRDLSSTELRRRSPSA